MRIPEGEIEEGCKCKMIRLKAPPDILDLATTLSDEEKKALAEGVFERKGRCKYLQRTNGCKHGAACDFCHVHPADGTVPSSPYEVWNPKLQKFTKLGKKERRAMKWKLRVAQPHREAWLLQKSDDLRRVAKDHAYCHNFGKPWRRYQLVFWTIPRLIDQALEGRKRFVEIFRQYGENVEPEDIGIWFGVDKNSHNPGHYAEGVQGHGVHTLVKGMAERLRKLAEHMTAPMLIFMEGDC